MNATSLHQQHESKYHPIYYFNSFGSLLTASEDADKNLQNVVKSTVNFGGKQYVVININIYGSKIVLLSAV